MTKEEFDNLKEGDIVFAEILKLNEWHPHYVLGKTNGRYLNTIYEAVLCPCDETETGYVLKSSVTRDISELKTKEEIWEIVKKEYKFENKKITCM